MAAVNRSIFPGETDVKCLLSGMPFIVTERRDEDGHFFVIFSQVQSLFPSLCVTCHQTFAHQEGDLGGVFAFSRNFVVIFRHKTGMCPVSCKDCALDCVAQLIKKNL